MTPSPEHPLDDQALRAIVEGTANATGEQFYAALVKQLATAMGTRHAWVTEWLPEERRLRALSFWAGDHYYGDYEYPVEGTPCEPVIDNDDLIHVPDNVVELFKNDPDLEPLGGVSYMGVPLRDIDGTILGHLAILHDQPMEKSEQVVSVFRIFAARAAAELRRLKRDKALKQRERELSLLFENTFDAIIELDVDLCVRALNPGARKLLGVAEDAACGQAFDAFLTPDSREQLVEITGSLRKDSASRTSCWVPDGFTLRRPSGEEVRVEASLSRYENEGREVFTMILRDLNERLEAEQRIRALTDETVLLREQLDALQGSEGIIGESPALTQVLAAVQQVAETDTSVLITGETGTGKELVARAVHANSPRRDAALVTVNCAAIPANLQESEFFGHERGAFTGATQKRVGRFQLADGGTIFLDEVGELPADLQAKLLRVLQQGEFEPVGSSRTEKVDVRVITATHRDLQQMVDQGTFRSDLLYRLNVFPIQVPALRERGDDIVLLAKSFLQRFAKQRGAEVPTLDAAAQAKLKGYDWPGNVRELENVIERAWITSAGAAQLSLDRALPDIATTSDNVSASQSASSSATEILTDAALRAHEKSNMQRALEACDWKISGDGGAAERLGLPPNTLASRMKALGIQRPRS